MGNCPPTFNRPYSITAEVEIPKGGAEGVLLAQGGVTGGYAFYVQEKKLHYLYNYAGLDEFVVTSDVDVPEGKVTLRYEFEPTGKPDPMHGKGTPGDGKLYIDGKLVGVMELPHTLPVLYGIEGLSCGYDFGERVTHRYDAPFTFTGEIGSVTVDLAGELTKDPQAELKRLMAQQ